MAKNRDRDDEFERENEEAEESPRSFARFVTMMNDGDAELELSAELQKLVMKLAADARATNQVSKGALALVIKIKVEPNGIAGVGYDLKVKAPEPKRGGSVFWLTKGGNLSPENPRQQRLPLMEVNSRSANLRDVPDAEFKDVRNG